MTDSAVRPIQPTADLFNVDSLQDVLAEFGVTPADIVAPTPPTVIKGNWDILCDQKWRIVDDKGNVIECTSHTGPLMFLHAGDPIPGDKFDSYAGYIVYTVGHPTRGKVVVTHGVPKDEHGNPTKSEVTKHLDKLSAGNLFMVAQFPTQSGFRVFRCVPVQRPAS